MQFCRRGYDLNKEKVCAFLIQKGKLEEYNRAVQQLYIAETILCLPVYHFCDSSLLALVYEKVFFFNL